jgi:hypothetical protein
MREQALSCPNPLPGPRRIPVAGSALEQDSSFGFNQVPGNGVLGIASQYAALVYPDLFQFLVFHGNLHVKGFGVLKPCRWTRGVLIAIIITDGPGHVNRWRFYDRIY